MALSRPALPLALMLTLAPALPAAADTFRVMLGNRALGTMEQSPASIDVQMAGTPLGVFDGTFTARLAQEGEALRYTARSVSTRENRTVSILSAGGKVVETAVEPPSEATPVSPPEAAPPGALNPIQAFARIASAGGCPEAFRMYDGRRVVVIAPTGTRQEGEVVTCHALYQVAEGPGHAGPLRLRQARLDFIYAPAGGQKVLAQARVSAGPITLSLSR